MTIHYNEGFFMGLDNDIKYAIKGILKNPILTVLREIKIGKR